MVACRGSRARRNNDCSTEEKYAEEFHWSLPIRYFPMTGIRPSNWLYLIIWRSPPPPPTQLNPLRCITFHGTVTSWVSLLFGNFGRNSNQGKTGTFLSRRLPLLRGLARIYPMRQAQAFGARALLPRRRAGPRSGWSQCQFSKSASKACRPAATIAGMFKSINISRGSSIRRPQD